jgi:hypothetical protein
VAEEQLAYRVAGLKKKIEIVNFWVVTSCGWTSTDNFTLKMEATTISSS